MYSYSSSSTHLVDPRIVLLVHPASESYFHALFDWSEFTSFCATLDDQGWEWQEIARELDAVGYLRHCGSALALSRSFWTCACDHAFIHHVSRPVCPRCGVRREQDQFRCLSVELRVGAPRIPVGRALDLGNALVGPERDGDEP